MRIVRYEIQFFFLKELKLEVLRYLGFQNMELEALSKNKELTNSS